MLSALGAQEAFRAPQYTSLLRDLATAAAGKALQPRQLAIALAVAEQLADVVGASGGGATAGDKGRGEGRGVAGGGGYADMGEVYVPDEDGVMRLTVELAFNDAPWLETTVAGGKGGFCGCGGGCKGLLGHGACGRTMGVWDSGQGRRKGTPECGGLQAWGKACREAWDYEKGIEAKLALNISLQGVMRYFLCM